MYSFLGLAYAADSFDARINHKVSHRDFRLRGIIRLTAYARTASNGPDRICQTSLFMTLRKPVAYLVQCARVFA